MSKTKQQVLKYLADKKNSIKLEINYLLDNKTIECDEDFFNNQIYNRKIHKKNTNLKIKIEKSFFSETKEYLNEIRILPISKILKQSNKIVTTKERCYAYEENYFNKQNLLKEIKNKLEIYDYTEQIKTDTIELNFFNEKNSKRFCRHDQFNYDYIENLKTYFTNIDEEIFKKKEKLSLEVIKTSIKINKNLPSICTNNTKDLTLPHFILKKRKNLLFPIDIKAKFFSYNDMLGIFQMHCTKINLINNLNKTTHGNLVHQSYKKFQQLPDMFIYQSCLNNKDLYKIDVNIESEMQKEEENKKNDSEKNNQKTTFKGDFLLEIDDDDFYDKFPMMMYKNNQMR